MKHLRIKLTFTNEEKPYLLDISSFFYDFELLHDFVLIIYATEYKDYKFKPSFWYRKGRPIKNEHKIKALRIKKESPLTVELIFNIIFLSSGAFWALLRIIEKLSNRKLNKEKLKLEVEKLKKENNIMFYKEQQAKIEIEFEQKLFEREAEIIYKSLLRKLKSNPLKLEDIEVLRHDEGKKKKDE